MINTGANRLIKHGSDLPVLPSGITRLLKVLNDNDIHFEQLAKEIESYPSISIKIVAIANSAWASPSVPVTNLPAACSLIGLNIVRSVSIALSISQAFDPSRCPSFSTKTFWTSALLNAESAFICASDNAEVCANTARFAGLLHNIGLLWLASQKPVETDGAILNAKKNQDCTLAELLYERLDMDYYSVGSQLAIVMEMPDIITDAISTETLYGLKSKNPLIKNNSYARLLTASVLKHADATNNDITASDFEQDVHFQKLADKLPKIQAMAESIFSN